MGLVGYILVGLYMVTLLGVSLYGIHRYKLMYLYRRYRGNTHKAPGTFSPLPRVTVQLPMYNEDAVARRCIEAVCHLDWPRELLQIQVLDDSTGSEADTARLATEEFRQKGFPIEYLHRENRQGYKAGALAEGLKTATGEFVAIFDADFVPGPSFIKDVIHHFTDPKVGVVQARWEHLNRESGILTRAQAIFLDAHFVVEHAARSWSGRFMHFNGTAGMWRKSTIADAGGWEYDTLTEDLDLSYRAQMKGWRFVYLPEVSAPAELPPEIISYKQQAHRWTKGSAQTGLKLLGTVLAKKGLGPGVKSEAFFHLTNTVVHPLVVMMTVFMYPAFYNALQPLEAQSIEHKLFVASLFILATCSAGSFFVFGQKELLGRKAGYRSLIYVPVLMGIGVGMSVNNTKAFFEAIYSHIRRRPSEFVRTLKYGSVGKRSGVSYRPARVFSFKRIVVPMFELLLGSYMVTCIVMGLRGGYGRLSVPFLMIFAAGYYLVGFSSLYVLWKMDRQQRAQELPDAPAASA